MGVIGPIIDALGYGSVVGIAFAFGLLACGVTTFEFANLLGTKKPPKPKRRRYRVLIEDEEGWPIRSVLLPAQAVTRFLRDIDRRPKP